ncbi:hypothetical protein [Ligilactobacillus agilis]|uniref:hypothetical protein n=1 Tax=Ligilactobacillus agilis TaxID=1601 RepID=UPI001DE3B9FF|nr:hypothetical protein [Ligilactobacillus agilis]HJG05781.1 hypothetical protein [Ligilactobacillus agilis]
MLKNLKLALDLISLVLLTLIAALPKLIQALRLNAFFMLVLFLALLILSTIFLTRIAVCIIKIRKLRTRVIRQGLSKKKVTSDEADAKSEERKATKIEIISLRSILFQRATMAQRKSNLKKWWKDAKKYWQDAKKEVTRVWRVGKQRIKKKKQIRKDVRQQIKKENTFYWYIDRGLRIVILIGLGGVVILMIGNISGIIPNSMSKCSLWILSVLFVLISCQASITVAINDKTPGILKAYFAKLEEDSTVNENILKSNQIPSKIINQKVKMWDWYILELMF